MVSCLTLRNGLSKETHELTKQQALLGRGTWANSNRVSEPRRTVLLHGSESRVLWISFWVFLFHYSDSGSFLVVHTLFSQDECQREGFWEVVRQVVSHFYLSQTLPVGGGLLVPCSLPGPVIKQLLQMVTMVPGQGGWFQSVCFP